MEIRRLESELIPPTTASEHGARVDKDRQGRSSQQHARDNKRPDESGAQDGDGAGGEEKSVPAAVYQPDGHVQEHPPTDDTPHAIDFIA